MQEFMMNKKEFSAFLNVNESQYSRYESANAQPSLEIAIKIANTLNRQITEIWYNEEDAE